YSDDQIVQLIIEKFHERKIILLAPVVKGRKGHYRELFEQIRKMGFAKVRVDGELKDIVSGMKLDRYKIHDIEIVIDRLVANEESKKRLYDGIVTSMKHGKKTMLVMDFENNKTQYFSRLLMCPTTGISYPEPEPFLFSFNSPYGACPCCNGLGQVSEVSRDKIIPDPKKSIKEGGIIPLGEYKRTWIFDKIEDLLTYHGYRISTPIKDIDEDVLKVIIDGNEGLENSINSKIFAFEGLISFLMRQSDDGTTAMQRWAQSFMNVVTCPDCHGYRLRKEALYFKIGDKHIGQLAEMDTVELKNWFDEVESHLSENQHVIAKEILKEIKSRIGFIVNVGLDYLSLNRSAKTLSGGEGQRIRLATQIGSELMNVLYILDEPSIGLHQRDNTKLIKSLQNLRDTGNSVIVVEHDREMIEEADFIVDIGPKAGVNGGQIVNAGTLAELNSGNSLTTKYLTGELKIEVPKERRKGNGEFLKLKGASGHNLKNVDLTIPLGTFTCVSGVSGSGKSSLINQTLYPILNAHFYNGVKKPLPYTKIEGLEHIDKVIEIDQTPIGRTPRSNPATYTKVFDKIRSLFTELPEAQIRGYKPGRFSFNVAGGRCETCRGAGIKIVEMNFLPDVHVKCDECNGRRYNRETLEIRYKGKSIGDVLDMPISEAVKFFENIPSIYRTVQTLDSVGLGYIKLGQASTTLSGGEAQRIKLSSELSKKSTGKTIYIMDEPSTGLHFEDIRILLEVLQRLVDEGNTVLVIEHNLDIIKVADYLVDVGPEGGKKGGNVLFSGTPEALTKSKVHSFTKDYLKVELK
ncbi:MAG TPA: excinuclease ABC subunit UvrA, partial [Crocinitomicaceae bacterium]|nr:excinuclease ABC subunit UvrA [Crocinitomicaceae bacterium]